MQVIYYYPWGFFYPMQSGAGVVAMRHMEYFRSRGFKVRLALWADDRPDDRQAFERHFDWIEDLCVLNLRRYPDIQHLFKLYTFGNYLKGHVAICDLPEFRSFMSSPANLIFCNYVFSSPFLDLAPRKAVRALETCDIMSKQFLLGRSAPIRLERDLRLEFDLYELFDVVLMLNEDEAEFAQSRSAAKIEYVPRGFETSLSGTPREVEGDESYDLLFVGCHHPPNIEGVRWFYEHIFRPHLKRHGLRWAIAGSIGEHLDLNDPDIQLLGRVDDLGGVYRRAKVVVVPLFQGAGISIKTLEALAHGKPVVSTPVGARGLPDCDQSLVKLCFKSQTAEVASRILEFCHSPPLRNEYGRKAIDYIQTHFSNETYFAQMDQLLTPLLKGTKGLAA